MSSIYDIIQIGEFYDEFFNLLQSYEYLSKEQVNKYKKMTHKDEFFNRNQ